MIGFGGASDLRPAILQAADLTQRPHVTFVQQSHFREEVNLSFWFVDRITYVFSLVLFFFPLVVGWKRFSFEG